MGEADLPFPFLIEKVRLVEDKEPGDWMVDQFLEDFLDRHDLLAVARVRRVDHVHQQVGLLNLAQRRPEGRDQMVGEFSYEPDRIGNDRLRFPGQRQAPGRRVEGGEELVLLQN